MDVRGPDGKIVRFPDGTDTAKINEVMSSIYAKPKSAPRSAVDAEAAKLNARSARLGKPGLQDLIVHGATLGLTDEVAGVGNVLMNALAAPFSSKVDFNPRQAYAAGNRAEDLRLAEARKRTGKMGTAAEIMGNFISERRAAEEKHAV